MTVQSVPEHKIPNLLLRMHVTVKDRKNKRVWNYCPGGMPWGAYNIWGLVFVLMDSLFLATLFNIEISGLPHRSLIEMEENVDAGAQSGVFSKITFGKRKNM